MGVVTSNVYGNINISNETIAQVVKSIASECYGVVGLASKSFLKNNKMEGIEVLKSDGGISLEISAIFKYGVNIESVGESLKKAIKYGLEDFTGIVVKSVNVNVLGVKV